MFISHYFPSVPLFLLMLSVSSFPTFFPFSSTVPSFPTFYVFPSVLLSFSFPNFYFFQVFKNLFIFVSSFSIFLSFLLLKFHSHRVLSFLQFLFALPASPFPSFPMFSVFLLFLISGIIARLTEMWIVETSVV